MGSNIVNWQNLFNTHIIVINFSKNKSSQVGLNETSRRVGCSYVGYMHAYVSAQRCPCATHFVFFEKIQVLLFLGRREEGKEVFIQMWVEIRDRKKNNGRFTKPFSFFWRKQTTAKTLRSRSLIQLKHLWFSRENPLTFEGWFKPWVFFSEPRY